MARLLLVDDEDPLRRFLSGSLTRGGFEVIEFANSPDARAWAEQNPLDVLVTDVALPDLDGFALARALVERDPDLPVVFISGYPTDIQEFRSAHPNCAFLMKPFPPKILLATIAGLSATRRS